MKTIEQRGQLTDQNLSELVRNRIFREDLCHRLNKGLQPKDDR
jgi:hypothetical protein